jgi:hypothetical protein
MLLHLFLSLPAISYDPAFVLKYVCIFPPSYIYSQACLHFPTFLHLFLILNSISIGLTLVKGHSTYTVPKKKNNSQIKLGMQKVPFRINFSSLSSEIHLWIFSLFCLLCTLVQKSQWIYCLTVIMPGFKLRHPRVVRLYSIHSAIQTCRWQNILQDIQKI